MVSLTESRRASFDLNDCIEDVNSFYAKASTPETMQEKTFFHSIIKAEIIQRVASTTDTKPDYFAILDNSIESFILKKYKNKQVFFLELMSCTPYEMQYHYLIEE